MRSTIRLLSICWLFTDLTTHAYAMELGCPPAVRGTPGSFPLDYNDPANKGHILYLVESAHMPPSVETLEKGNSSSVGGDLAYVLNAYPNHPRGLNAMARLGEKEHSEQPHGAIYSIPCYFERAMAFVPQDPIPPMLYGVYLAWNNQDEKALKYYQASEALDPDNANLQYDEGLLYFKMKQYDKAAEYAHKAYAGGFSLPGLRLKLQSVGKWSDQP